AATGFEPVTSRYFSSPHLLSESSFPKNRVRPWAPSGHLAPSVVSIFRRQKYPSGHQRSKRKRTWRRRSNGVGIRGCRGSGRVGDGTTQTLRRRKKSRLGTSSAIPSGGKTNGKGSCKFGTR